MFKVHNAGDSLPEEQFAEAQNALMRHLAAAGLPVPALLTLSAAAADAAPGPYGSSSGCGASDGLTLRAAADDGQMHAMRIMSWMPGTLLVDVQQVGGALGGSPCHLLQAEGRQAQCGRGLKMAANQCGREFRCGRDW